MGSKLNPGQYDCYKNALPYEPMFVLLARDPDAAYVVKIWAGLRALRIKHGNAPIDDEKLIDEAMSCADDMISWRAINDRKWRLNKDHE